MNIEINKWWKISLIKNVEECIKKWINKWKLNLLSDWKKRLKNTKLLFIQDHNEWMQLNVKLWEIKDYGRDIEANNIKKKVKS